MANCSGSIHSGGRTALSPAARPTSWPEDAAASGDTARAEDRRRVHAATCPPKVNVAVASSNSHGRSRMKLSSEVRTSSKPPRRPPTRLMNPRRSVHSRAWPISRRYATALDNDAGHIANVDVAFADTGATPAYSSAGSVRNDPPPATEFNAPPRNAAANSSGKDTGHCY